MVKFAFRERTAHQTAKASLFTISRPPAGLEESDSITSHLELNKSQTFNPCCCDCDGKCTLIKWCKGIAVYGVLQNLTIVSLTLVLLALDNQTLLAFYRKQYKASSNFVQDYKLTYKGYRHTCEIQFAISALMLTGYGMLLTATLKSAKKKRWREFLCLGQPLVTAVSIIIQISHRAYYYTQGEGTLVNYLLLPDIYFAVCAVGLFINIRAEKHRPTDFDSFDFPEYPPDRVKNLPLIYVSRKKKGQQINDPQVFPSSADKII